MNKYEAVVVFPGTLGDDVVKDESTRIQTLIASKGGTNTAVTTWGKKEIAYSVQGSKLGTYTVFNFDLPVADQVTEIVLSLRLMERVGKFQIHKLSDRVRKFQGNPKRSSLGSGSDGEEDFADEE